ncbi:extended synaptotagmin [Thraustotheca clavata]|uniref:Extended synaptotagmin n=1 Tax=Thraustotheca clavata TaxID=74557 RepID=A0A1W0A755_9STRA|nr:extended synaptotagmin [Thraustotheca clavata]
MNEVRRSVEAKSCQERDDMKRMEKDESRGKRMEKGEGEKVRRGENKDGFKMPSFKAIFKEKIQEKTKEERNENKRLTHDVMEGFLRVYLKKHDKNVFFLGKSRYFVVVNAENPAIEIFTNEAKTSSIYILSLSKATMNYEPKYDNTVVDNTFHINAHAWTKYTTIHYRDQTFVFREDKPDKALAWVKCISRAILNASKHDGALGADIFRATLSQASYHVADDSCMGNESDLDEDDNLPLSRSSSNDEILVHPATDLPDDLWKNLNKLNPFSPTPKTQPGSTRPSPTNEVENAKVKLQFPTISTPTSPIEKITDTIPEDTPKATSPIITEDRNEMMRRRNFDKATHEKAAVALSPTPMHNFWSICHGRIWAVAASISHKSGGLITSFFTGWFELSILYPIALAGFFAAHQNSFPYWYLMVMFLIVHTSATAGCIHGVITIATVLLTWNYVAEKELLRKRIRAEAQQILLAEKTNYHNYPCIEFPSWVKFSDIERAEWLNKAIERSWPHIKVALRNSMMSCLNPLLDSNKPAFISALSLVNIDMGSLAPSFGGIKCIPMDDALSDDPCTEISWDAEVRYIAGEDQLAEIKVAHHVGAAARVRLKDTIIMGTMRITLRPMSVFWPGFSGISVSFISHPRIEFSLTAAKINVTNVPFVSEFLQTFIRDMIINNMVWPKVLDIPLWDPTSNFIDTPETPKELLPRNSIDRLGSMTSSFSVDDEGKQLQSFFGPGVISLNLSKLVALIEESCEVYCIISLQESDPKSPEKTSTLQTVSTPQKTHKTEIRRLEKDTACFDEKYEFFWEKTTRPIVQIEVWKHNHALPDEVLGTTTVDLSTLSPKRDHGLKIDVNLALATETQAQLHLHACRRLFYSSKTLTKSALGHRSTIEGLGIDICVGMLQVTLHHSVDLTTQESTPDIPAIYCILTCEKQSYTTSVLKQQKSVVWSEQFSYFVYSIEAATLTLELYEKGKNTACVGQLLTSVLELRKRLSNNTESIKETLPLRHGHAEYSHAFTLSFTWRQLMS